LEGEVSHDDAASDPNTAQWTPPESPEARSPAWMPPSSGPYDPWATPGAPGAAPPGWQPLPVQQPPPRRGMPRWAKVVLGIWIVITFLSLVFQLLNLMVFSNR
jgi:hypothetical protein